MPEFVLETSKIYFWNTVL